MKHVKSLAKAEKLLSDLIICLIEADDALENENRLEETDEFIMNLKQRLVRVSQGVECIASHASHLTVQGTLFGPDPVKKGKQAG